MNPLKVRVSAEVIATIFICSALLLGIIPLSFNQAAFAQQAGPPEGRGPPPVEDTAAPEERVAPEERGNTPQTPQCPDGSAFKQGECVKS